MGEGDGERERGGEVTFLDVYLTICICLSLSFFRYLATINYTLKHTHRESLLCVRRSRYCRAQKIQYKCSKSSHLGAVAAAAIGHHHLSHRTTTTQTLSVQQFPLRPMCLLNLAGPGTPLSISPPSPPAGPYSVS